MYYGEKFLDRFEGLLWRPVAEVLYWPCGGVERVYVERIVGESAKSWVVFGHSLSGSRPQFSIVIGFEAIITTP